MMVARGCAGKDHRIKHFFFNIGMLFQDSHDSTGKKVAIVAARGLKPIIEALCAFMIPA